MLTKLIEANPGMLEARGAVGNTPLHLCCLMRKMDFVKLFVERFEARAAPFLY